MYLIKLGGSVITDKKQLYSFKNEITSKLVSEIKESGKDFMLVHGAGSYGHIIAHKYKLQNGFLEKEQLKGFARVHEDVRKLNLKVLEIMRECGENPMSIPPCSILICENKKIIDFNSGLFEACKIIGLTPVTFGDVVFDSKIGYCICSGDALMLQLSKVFRPEKVIFVADVDGIFDKNPMVHKDAKLMKYVNQKVVDDLKKHEADCSSCKNSIGEDATGGMLRKLEIMLQISQLGVESIILNGLQPSRLRECLIGKEVIGTIVKAKMD